VQVARDAGASLEQLASTFRATAARAPVRDALLAASTGRLSDAQRAAARAALAPLATRDTTFAVELWDSTGHPVLGVGTLAATACGVGSWR